MTPGAGEGDSVDGYIEGIVVVRVEEGKLTEGSNSYDQLGLPRQIGALAGAGERDTFLSQTQRGSPPGPRASR
jgi:hypothetical protein